MHFLVSMFKLQPSHTLLDLGCGPLCLGSQLIAYLEPEHYTGVDKDSTLLGAGKALLHAKGLEHKKPKLVWATDLDATDCFERFDFLWSHSVLIHMDPTTVASALRFMRRHLAPRGVAYFTMNIGPHKILGEWTFGPNYQHPVPECEGLRISPIGLLTEMGDVVWCPPDSGMQATMLRAVLS